MATFKFGRTVDIHWNGYDIQGPAETVFSIPDQLYEEFDADIAPVEPTLVWLDTNEFQTLSDSVSPAAVVGSSFIDVTLTTAGKQISITSDGASVNQVLTADGNGGVTFETPTGGAGDVNAEVLRTYVKNSSGSTISKGQVVYITGSNGTNALIDLASNTSDDSSSKTLGIAASTMTNNAFGYVVENGQLSNIDTSAATAGDAVWLGSTPGSYQFTVPAEPNHAVYLGVVTKANASTGEILVKVQNGYELNELHDVFTTGVSSSLPLVYSTTSSGWIAQALSSVGIADDAIVTTKILDGAVTSAKIATGSINSTHIAANAVVAGDIAADAVTSGNIAAGAVNTAKIDSTGGSNGWVLTANGSGGVSFSAAGSGFSLISSQTISSGVSTVEKPSNAKIAYIRLIAGGQGGSGGHRTTSTTVTQSGRGGVGGGRLTGWVSASSFSSIISYSIGGGGSGVAGASYTSATIGTSAATLGTYGGDTTFGAFIAYGNHTAYYQQPYYPDESRPSATIYDGYPGLHSGAGGSSVAHTQSASVGSGGGSGHTDGINISAFLSAAGGGGAAGGNNSSASGSGTNGSNAGSPGHGGGAGGVKRFPSGTTATANTSSGNGGDGAYPGGGGGASGAIATAAASLSTFTITQGNGGNGAGGQIYVEWYG